MSQKIKLIVSILIALLLILPAISVSAASTAWVPVGTPGFSAGSVSNTYLAFNGSTPYVAFQDNDNSGKATVMRFNGTAWEVVGSAGFSVARVYDVSLVFNGDTPYVSYRLGGSGKGTVMRFNGTAWESVGPAGFTPAMAAYISLAFSGSTPYVAYQDQYNSNKATVMRFNGTDWEVVGSAGFSAGNVYYTSIAFSGSTPYVAYADNANDGKATVMMFDGEDWVSVGSAGFSTGIVNKPSLVFSGDTPYVAYTDWGLSGKASVMKYDGAKWVNVGSPGFSADNAGDISLAFSGDTPYVAYEDMGNGTKATLMKYDGASWVNVGHAGFSAGEVSYPSLAFNGSTACVAYSDAAHSYKATLMHYTTYDSGSITISGTPQAVYHIKQGPTVVRDDVTLPAGGTVTVNDLPLGSYSVVEKSPPAGYFTYPQAAVLTQDGQEVSLTFTPCQLVTLTTQKSDVTAYGGADGQIIVTPSGGTGTYEYSIGNGWQSSDTFTGLAGGIYYVQARDQAYPANVCDAVSVVIGQPGLNGTCLLSQLPSKVWKDTTYQIILPAGYSDPAFSSGNNAVATVNKNGLAHFITNGKVKLTMKAKLNGKLRTVSKTVTVLTPVKTINLDLANISLTKGKIIAGILPLDASNKKVTWGSSDPRVASVSQSGEITAKSPGSVTITATAKDGSGVKATLTLRVAYSIHDSLPPSLLSAVPPAYNDKLQSLAVSTPVNSINLSYANLSLTKGKLTVGILPLDASNKKVTWSSSDPKVVSVSQSGVITAKSAGTVTITVKAKDGSGVQATFKLVVMYSICKPAE